MSHDRQASRGEFSNGIGDSAATFQLHCRGAAFLEEPCRIAHGLLGRNLIREKRHIGHHQRAVCTSGDRARVMNHHVQSDGIVVSNPMITFPRESPTSSRSIPARSSSRAIVAS